MYARYYFPDTEKKSANNYKIDIGITPRYSEITLYTASLTFLILLLIDTNLINDTSYLIKYTYDKYGPVHLIYPALFFTTMIASIFQAFTKKELPVIMRQLMSLYIGIIYLFISVISFDHIPYIGIITPLMAIFPLVNIAYAIVMLVIAGEYMLQERNAKLHETFISTITVLAIIIITKYILGYHWSIILSICMTFSTAIDNASSKLFGNRIPKT